MRGPESGLTPKIKLTMSLLPLIVVALAPSLVMSSFVIEEGGLKVLFGMKMSLVQWVFFLFW